MTTRWYRRYEGTVSDPKLHEAAMIAGVSRSVAIATWDALLESAAGRNNCGSFDTGARRIAVLLGERLENIEAVFSAFQELGMIADGAVKQWKTRQYESDVSTTRVRKFRDKLKRGNANETFRNGDETPCNADETAPETESETDISEPNGSSPRPWTLPVGVSLQVWTDFLSNRKRKRLGNTPTAWKSFQDDLARVSLQTGIPPPQLIEQCTAKGWGAIYDPREGRNGAGPGSGIGKSAAAFAMSGARSDEPF